MGEIICGSSLVREKTVWGSFCALAFVGLAVVKAPEGLVLGDVWVEELERVLRDEPVGDHFVVAYDVGERERTQTVFSVGLHRVELHLPCWETSQLAEKNPLGSNPKLCSALGFLATCTNKRLETGAYFT